MSSNAVIDTASILNIKHIKGMHLLEHMQYNLFTTIYVIMELTGNCAKEETKIFYKMNRNKIAQVHLSVEDLVEMSKVPESKRISDAELSCFVKANSYGCKAITDDKTAVKYAKRFISLGEIVGIKKLIIEAYGKDLLCDHEVQDCQKILEANKFKINGCLLEEAAREKYLRCQYHSA